MGLSKNNITQEELTFKILRRIYNRGKRKGYVSPEYIEKTLIEGLNIRRFFKKKQYDQCHLIEN